MRNTIKTLEVTAIQTFTLQMTLDGLASKEEELVNLVKKLDETFSRYRMEIKTKKIKTKQAHDEQ